MNPSPEESLFDPAAWRAAALAPAQQEAEALAYVRERFAAGDGLIPLSQLWRLLDEWPLRHVRRRLRRRLRKSNIPLYCITNRICAFESDLARLLGASFEDYFTRVGRLKATNT